MKFSQHILRIAERSHLPRRTIRLRLTAIYSALFLACGAGLLAVTYVLVDHASGDYFSSTGPNGSRSVGVLSPAQGSHSASNPTVSSSGGAPLSPRQAAAQAHQFQALAVGYHANELHQLLVYSGVALAIMAVAALALGWVVAGRVLRPIRTITTTVRQISATNLHRRLSLAGPDDELKELGDTFDDLLTRMENFIQAQRQFVANASHELRTPIAWQRTLVQVALGDPDADVTSLRATHERVLASGVEQERLIEALLTLTKSQAGLHRVESLDLAAIAHQVVETKQPEANRRGLSLCATLMPALVTGDGRLVERLIANLVDNALRYNLHNGQVDVITITRHDRATISVRNTGSPVPQEALEGIIRPFQRLDTERTGHGEGFGLGLSIVQAIATAHDAVLAMTAPQQGGLDVEVSFPQRAVQPARGTSLPQPPCARSGPALGLGRLEALGSSGASQNTALAPSHARSITAASPCEPPTTSTRS